MFKGNHFVLIEEVFVPPLRFIDFAALHTRQTLLSCQLHCKSSNFSLARCHL